jgi:uncharacterized protein (DUF433 family)
MADLNSIIHSDPEIHSGDPVFVGTRVPVRTLLDYIGTVSTFSWRIFQS